MPTAVCAYRITLCHSIPRLIEKMRYSIFSISSNRCKIINEFQSKIQINKTVFQFFCPVQAIRTEFFKFSHIPANRHVNLLNGFGFEVFFVLYNKIFHNNGVEHKDFQATEDIRMLTCKKSSDLWKSGKNHGNPSD